MASNYKSLQSSRPKFIIVSDGIINKALVAKSLDELKAKSKSALGYQANIDVLVIAKNKGKVETDIDFTNLEDSSTLMISPHPDSEIEFSISNLLEKIKINTANIFLFTPSDFVALADLDIKTFSSSYCSKFLREVKEIASSHISEEQELRDLSCLRQLDHGVDHILTKVIKSPKEMTNLSEDDLELLSNLDTERTSLVFGPSVRQIKEAAANHLSLKRLLRPLRHGDMSENRTETTAKQLDESTGTTGTEDFVATVIDKAEHIARKYIYNEN